MIMTWKYPMMSITVMWMTAGIPTKSQQWNYTGDSDVMDLFNDPEAYFSNIDPDIKSFIALPKETHRCRPSNE